MFVCLLLNRQFILFSDDMRGHGVMSAVGGRGYEAAGGGSGGRIALYTDDSNEYRGALSVSG